MLSANSVTLPDAILVHCLSSRNGCTVNDQLSLELVGGFKPNRVTAETESNVLIRLRPMQW